MEKAQAVFDCLRLCIRFVRFCLLDDEVDGLVALLVRAVHIVLAGHDGVEDDADDVDL